MGSCISPKLADIYMEDLEKRVLNTADPQPKLWLRYVDDTFVIWSHGDDELQRFLQRLNSVHPDIQFTMEKEVDKKLPFLDVLVERLPGGTLGHSVFRKSTHTDRYLHNTSHHHPSQKQSLIHTLVKRAIRISDDRSIRHELEHLKTALGKNGYHERRIHRVIQHAIHGQKKPSRDADTNFRTTACIPYVEGVTQQLTRILRKHDIRVVTKPVLTLRSLFNSPKDPLSNTLRPGVYQIDCSCGSCYIGQTGRSIDVRIREHKQACRLGRIEKSAVAEHCVDVNHVVDFNNTKVLASESRLYHRLVRESIEIIKRDKNFNRSDGFVLDPSWKHVVEHMFTSKKHKSN